MRLLGVFMTLLLGGSFSAVAAGTLPGPLVSADWLAKHRDQVQVVDVREKVASFEAADEDDPVAGHIPGAILLPWDRVRQARTEDGQELLKMRPPADEFESLMRESGINDGPIVIVYPGMGSSMTHAARLYWTLKYFGHQQMALLDGGFVKWKAEGRAVASGSSKPPVGNFSIRQERQELLATTADVQRAAENEKVKLIDSRNLEYYLGLDQKPYVGAPGHIPGAKLFAHDLVTNTFPPTFRSPDELRELAKGLGVEPDAPLITYCNSGNLSSGVWFAFSEILQNDNARMYDGSMHAWTKRQGRGTVKYRLN